MRHLTAAQRGEGGWHYVSASSEGGHPLGYCAEHEPHATEDEARACFRRWERDKIVRREDSYAWGTCRVCKGPTRDAAEVHKPGFGPVPTLMCRTHTEPSEVYAAVGLAGDLADDAWVS